MFDKFGELGTKSNRKSIVSRPWRWLSESRKQLPGPIRRHQNFEVYTYLAGLAVLHFLAMRTTTKERAILKQIQAKNRFVPVQR